MIIENGLLVGDMEVIDHKKRNFSVFKRKGKEKKMLAEKI
jgi:hypothetical protein